MTVTAKSPWVNGVASRARLGSPPAWRAFAVVAPFRVYAEFGTTATNAWYGSSRIHSACRAAINAAPGDELHCLPGGIFLVRPAKGAAEVALAPPRSSAFEKPYGAPTDLDLVEGLRRRGAAVPLDGPPLAVDYAKVRRSLTAARLPDLHATLVEVEPSPQLSDFERRAGHALDDLTEAGASVRVLDHDAHSPTIRAEIRIAGAAGEGAPDVVVTWAFLPDRLWVETRDPSTGGTDRREIDWSDLDDVLARCLPLSDGAPAPA